MATLTMFDSIDLSQIPKDAEAVAGYTSGRWPTFNEIPARFPHAHHLSIAVTAEHDADCLDIEAGDARPDQAALWVRRQDARGIRKPVVYCSVSQANTLVGLLAASGVPRNHYRLWTAHYTGKPHLCSQLCFAGLKTVADATQYTDKALGRNLDASLVSDGFFTAPKPPVPVAARRARLRAWVMGQRNAGRSWAWLKKQAKWRVWRKLGGR